LFIATLFLAAFQVSVAGYGSDDSSLFDLITLTMAEEENEESGSEKKEETKNASQTWFRQSVVASPLINSMQLWSEDTVHLYQSIMGEVVSPPPEFH